MGKFSELKTTQKGAIGEEIVIKMLEEKGYKVYIPAEKDKSHPIDLVIFSENGNASFVDIKTKPRRKYYEDTGFDLKDFNFYKSLNGQVIIVFVDEFTKKVYGNSIKNLEKPIEINGINYPQVVGNVILFPLVNMVELGALNDSDIEKIKNKSTGNYKY